MNTEPLIDQSSLTLTVDENFDYVVKRQRRKTLAVHILDDATVEVRAPKWVPKYEIAHFIEKRAEWIVSQRNKSLQKLHATPGFYQGQEHYYLGKRYPLSIHSSRRSSVTFEDLDNADELECAERKMHFWTIKVSDINNSEQIQKTLERWYRQRAKPVFEERIQYCFALFPSWFQERYSIPALTIRKMRRRWGSCSSKGDVTLNLLLIKMPLECIDYVIIHELCHFKEFHHGEAFYALLAEIMPEWRAAEQLIENISHR